MCSGFNSDNVGDLKSDKNGFFFAIVLINNSVCDIIIAILVVSASLRKCLLLYGGDI